jgi:hypothetical protein
VTTPRQHSAISRAVQIGLAAVIVIGLAWRLVRYALQMPLWGDETALALNILERSFAGLLSPLDHAQVSPILFLWLEKLAIISLGTSELALRFLPLMAGLLGLWLFYRLSQRVLEPLPASLATAILAVSYFTVRHAVEVKPYSFDLLASTALLLCTVEYMKDPQRRVLIAWTLLSPVAVLVSYPAVFIFGASALVLLVQMRSARNGERAIWMAGSLLGALAFFWMFDVVSSKQYTALETPMTTYWKESFPPKDVWQFPLWFLKINAGYMMAYPIGDKHWGSIGTLLLCLVGVGYAWKKWPRSLLALVALPFVLTLIAAALHRYPYGGSARIAQHLAPGICLLAGLGAGWLIELQPNRKLRCVGVWIIFSLLAVIGLAGIARDCLKRSKTPGDARARLCVREWLSQEQDASTWIVWEPMPDVVSNFQWYLRRGGRSIVWNGRDNASWTSSRSGIRLLSFDPNVRLAESVAERLPHHYLAGSTSEQILVGPPEMGPSTWSTARFEDGSPSER